MCYTNLERRNSTIPLNPNKINEENLDENFDKLKYLVNHFSSGIRKRFKTYSKIEQYKSLYNKYYAEKRTAKKSNTVPTTSTTTPFKKCSIVDYLLRNDIDYMSMNQDEILRFTDRLHYMLSEATTALELIKEDITSCYESKIKELKDSYEVELAGINSVIQGASHYKKAV